LFYKRGKCKIRKRSGVDYVGLLRLKFKESNKRNVILLLEINTNDFKI